MKKATWILLLLTGLANLPLLAQQNFASISFGAVLPLGDYASTGDLASNGYARTGGAIKFDAAYFPVSYFGIGGSFGFGSNYAVRDSFLTDLSNYIVDNASSIIDIPDYADVTYGSGFWNYINLFVGPHFSIRASQRLYFDFRGLVGATILRMPDQELRINFDQTEIFSTASRSRLAFGFTAGGGFRYELNSNIALKLAADFFQSRAKFEYTFDLFKDVAEEVPPISTNFPVRTVEITAGLAYSF